ncbi:trypsin-like serine protease, partial [Streptomyces silvensis]|uniref:trypsin-like serine protease n=1 Tax=Streptomyces silvensis TaxID=1765722 RepID=UPI0018E29E42
MDRRRLRRAGRLRPAWAAALLAVVVAAGFLTGPKTSALAGTPAPAGSYEFAAKMNIGDGLRSCSGTLVDRFWVLTAASCFSSDPAQGTPVPPGAPAHKTTAVIGRSDLTSTAGHVVDVTELAPHPDRDLLMARLAQPVTDIEPLAVSRTAPVQGETLRVAGYGRTRTDWVPDRLHTGTFDVTSAGAAVLGIDGTTPASAVCKGDTGGPAIRERDGRQELAAVSSTSWQAGCLGSDETRTGATASRVDDVGPWIQKTRFKTSQIRNKHSDRCLVVWAQTPGNNATAAQYDCRPDFADQVWSLEPVQGG